MVKAIQGLQRGERDARQDILTGKVLDFLEINAKVEEIAPLPRRQPDPDSRTVLSTWPFPVTGSGRVFSLIRSGDVHAATPECWEGWVQEGRSGFARPVQVLAQEVEGRDAVDGVWTVEELDLGAVGEAHLHIVAAGAGVFVGDPFIGGDAVFVSALTMKGRGKISQESSA